MNSLQIGVAVVLALGLMLAALRRGRVSASANDSPETSSVVDAGRVIASAAAARHSLASRALHGALSVLTAALLYFALFPPSRQIAQDMETLTVLTADWQLVEGVTLPDGPLLALPEADADASIARAPDLASALRQRPQLPHLRVIGAGLAARDQDAARGRLVEFRAVQPGAGLAELQWTRQAQLGAPLQVAGRRLGKEASSVSLLDPAGQPLAQSPIDAEGRFSLAGSARGLGPVVLQLAMLDAAGASLQRVELPVLIHPVAPLRVLLLAGAPGPETKFLRRWAEDAGLQLRSRVQLGPRLVQGGNRLAPTPAELAETDLLILDERAFAALGPAGRGLIVHAVRDGLGLLLRLTDLPGPNETQRLQDLGFEVLRGDGERELQLPGIDQISLRRLPLEVTGEGVLTLQSSAAGEAVAAWRSMGLGRIGLWWLGDSFVLRLGGESESHSGLWSHASQMLARPSAATQPRQVSLPAVLGERSVLCGEPHPGRALGEAGASFSLPGDASGCAAWWPQQTGWQRIERVDGTVDWHYVHRADSLQARLNLQQRMQQLLVEPLLGATAHSLQRPGDARPWALAWLLSTLLLWWRERRAN
jgi:hypothetical protein